jgi:hypothetical protein
MAGYPESTGADEVLAHFGNTVPPIVVCGIRFFDVTIPATPLSFGCIAS